MTRSPGEDSGAELSIARLALAAMGAATTVLVVVTVVIVALRPGPVGGLVIALVGVAAAITAMGVVSKRLVRRSVGPEADGTDRRS
ncbi:hypothetical protein [Rhodococcus sp. W8901]|uniref:hypothetical protein n=1 Tax=Rhodococcus sp. W8901 TaxID=2742603 RepID=UPI00158234DB|nr:hypothetical protein [Rhodococcus sp. W8901]QKT11880.1 hypothetical protein HUN07_15165 [Rhodococcus sp. W8901]